MLEWTALPDGMQHLYSMSCWCTSFLTQLKEHPVPCLLADPQNAWSADYGRLSSWQIAFGMDSTPLGDRNRCQTAQVSRICCWKFGISGDPKQHSSTWFCVWIACKPASGHIPWNIREPILSQPGLYFELQGSMFEYMHLGVLDAIFNAWKAKQLQSRAPQIPSQAVFEIHCKSKSTPQADLTQTIISMVKTSNYSQHTVSNDIELRQLQPQLQGDTVCFACKAQRHLKLGLAPHESLTFSLHTHPFWEKALVTSIKGVESEIKRLNSATEERTTAKNALADAEARVQNTQQQILGVREQTAKLSEAVEHTFEWADRHQDLETQHIQLMSSKVALDRKVLHWQGAVAQVRMICRHKCWRMMF